MSVFSSVSFCSIGASKLGNCEKKEEERMKEKNTCLNKREKKEEELLSDAVANCRVLMGWSASLQLTEKKRMA
jgi:hypothetical protein